MQYVILRGYHDQRPVFSFTHAADLFDPKQAAIPHFEQGSELSRFMEKMYRTRALGGLILVSAQDQSSDLFSEDALYLRRLSLGGARTPSWLRLGRARQKPTYTTQTWGFCNKKEHPVASVTFAYDGHD